MVDRFPDPVSSTHSSSVPALTQSTAIQAELLSDTRRRADLWPVLLADGTIRGNHQGPYGSRE